METAVIRCTCFLKAIIDDEVTNNVETLEKTIDRGLQLFTGLALMHAFPWWVSNSGVQILMYCSFTFCLIQFDKNITVENRQTLCITSLL